MNALEIKNLSYTYPDGKTGLAGVNLTVGDSMRVALVGSNGSGKTTLLFHVVGFLDGDGIIDVMGIKRTAKSIKEIRKRVGFLFSSVEYQFIMPDLLNDVMLSISENSLSREQKRETAMKWLEQFNLAQYADVNPLDLSSGEMKRAALAAIMARNPGLLLLDEPLNNLDRNNSLMLINLLKSYKKTIVIATHRRLIVDKLASHIAVMENGRITGLYDKEQGLKLSSVNGLLF